MATGQLMLAIEISIVSGGLAADKISICACIGQAATDDLLDLTLM